MFSIPLALSFFELISRGWSVFIRDFQQYFMQPLDVEIFLNAMLASVTVGIVSGVVGSLVVVRGMSFFGDALAHAILPGVAFMFQRQRADNVPGFIPDNQSPLLWGGLGAGILSALIIGFLTRDDRLKNDTAIGVVFAGMFALGIAMISRLENFSNDLTHILFGEVFGVSRDDLELIVIFGIILIGIVILFYKEFMIISFDPILAQTLRLPSEALRYLLLILISVTIVIALQIVGIVLMVALLVTPAATASLMTHRLYYMMIIAGLIGALSSVIGFYISVHFDVATGASIVLTATVIFILVFVQQAIVNYLSTTSNFLRNLTTAKSS